jgi:hypothetical protein
VLRSESVINSLIADESIAVDVPRLSDSQAAVYATLLTMHLLRIPANVTAVLGFEPRKPLVDWLATLCVYVSPTEGTATAKYSFQTRP